MGISGYDDRTSTEGRSAMGRDFTRFEIDLADDGVATVTMTRPPVNAVDLAMYREIWSLFVDIDQIGKGVRAVVLTGAGKHFCAGNDLDDFASMDSDNVRERMYHVREAFFAIQDCAVPVVGAVAGAALGTGLCLAAACDFVLASPDAVFGLPELSVGVHGGARHLGRLVGQPMARWMFFTGERLSAERMYALGAIIDVVPRDELLDAAREQARRIAAYSPVAVRLGKQGLNDIEFARHSPRLRTRTRADSPNDGSPRLEGRPSSEPNRSAAGIRRYLPSTNGLEGALLIQDRRRTLPLS